MDKECKSGDDCTCSLFWSGNYKDDTYGSVAMKIVSHQPDKLLSCMASPENV